MNRLQLNQGYQVRRLAQTSSAPSATSVRLRLKRARRNGFAALIVCVLAIGSTLTIALTTGGLSLPLVAAQTTPTGQSELQDTNGSGGGGGLISYFTSARQLLSSGLDAHSQAQAYNGLMPNEDPRTAEMLRETIDKTTDLIETYRQDGLSNMPALPNLPGLSALVRLPDKLLRAELSMLQDGIRMAQEMRERPITATVNTPKGKSFFRKKKIIQLFFFLLLDWLIKTTTKNSPQYKQS